MIQKKVDSLKRNDSLNSYHWDVWKGRARQRFHNSPINRSLTTDPFIEQ